MIRIHRIPTIALLLIAGAISLWGADKTLTIALAPDGFSQPERVPLQNYLADHTGRPVKFVVPNSYKETMDGLADGSIDFAVLGGLTYVRSHAKLGVIPLVQRTSDLQFHAVFIAGTGTSIHNLRDLRGKKFAFGDVNSTSGHLMPYLELKHAGLNPDKDFESRYSGGHPLTVQLVESGIVDAGVLDETVFNTLISNGKTDRNKVRIFHTSKPFVDYAWVARKSVSEDLRDKFTRAMLDLREGKDDAVLKILRGSKYVKVKDEDYATLRQVARELNML